MKLLRQISFSSFLLGLLVCFTSLWIIAARFYSGHDIFVVFAAMAVPSALILQIYGMLGNSGLSSHSARVLGFIVIFCLSLAGAYMSTFSPTYRAAGGILDRSATAVAVAVFFGFSLLAPGLWVFSVPSRWLSVLPLFANYILLLALANHSGAMQIFNGTEYFVGIGLIFFGIAAYQFPKHRRIVEYWRPSRLPRIKPARGGVTLIELLIVIAILSILASGVAQVASAGHRLLERQEDWRRAITLAEDEIALLRARDVLPEIGTHPLEPELTKDRPLASRAEVEIRPGPAGLEQSLREVRVNIRIRGDANDRDVTLAVILPARK